jgi:hypothetical protein
MCPCKATFAEVLECSSQDVFFGECPGLENVKTKRFGTHLIFFFNVLRLALEKKV